MNKEDKLFRHNNYRHLIQVRTSELEEDKNKMIIEGKAVTFDEETVLFRYNDHEYKEIISRGSFDKCDFSKAFLKYNHSDNIMAMARVKNETLTIDVRDDGVYIRAHLANTSAGRDLYELVKRGDIDKMSFAFTIGEESYDESTYTWTVRKVDTLYDVAAVEMPAYENTQLFARRYGEVEASRKQEVEALALEKEQLVNIIRLRIGPKKTKS